MYQKKFKIDKTNRPTIPRNNPSPEAKIVTINLFFLVTPDLLTEMLGLISSSTVTLKSSAIRSKVMTSGMLSPNSHLLIALSEYDNLFAKSC